MLVWGETASLSPPSPSVPVCPCLCLSVSFGWSAELTVTRPGQTNMLGPRQHLEKPLVSEERLLGSGGGTERAGRGLPRGGPAVWGGTEQLLVSVTL